MAPGCSSRARGPLRSRIGPRGASMRIDAQLVVLAPPEVLRARTGPAAPRAGRRGRRRRRARRQPRIATRSASCGVKRYGLSTRGSRREEAARAGSRRAVLAKQPHLRAPLGCGRGEQAPRRARRPAGVSSRLKRDVRRAASSSSTTRAGDRLAEQEVQDERAERYEHRHDGDREERRVRAVAAGRLAVAADPVAGEREQERGDAERPEVRRVDEQPGEEAADRAEDRAAQ